MSNNNAAAFAARATLLAEGLNLEHLEAFKSREHVYVTALADGLAVSADDLEEQDKVIEALRTEVARLEEDLEQAHAEIDDLEGRLDTISGNTLNAHALLLEVADTLLE